MAKLKSLGLAGAKRAGEATTKALRKLFGRQDSTGPEEGAAAASSDGQSGIGNDDAGAAGQNQGQGQADLTSRSDPDAATSTTHKDASSSTNRDEKSPITSENHSKDGVTMQSTIGKENLAPGWDSNKENEPPQSTGDDLALDLKKLDLRDTNPKQEILATTPILPITPVEEEVRPLTPDELLTEEERAFRQERRKHLVFIEEALDMVGH